MTEIKLLPHNQDMVNRIEQAMIFGNHKIFYTEATGLGKSFIFMYLVYKYFRNKKVLYICPKKHIWYNLNSYKEFELIKDCVTMLCNADFNMIKDRHYGYDVIFIDEVHHLTAPIQGENIRTVAEMTINNNPNAYVYGFTATPNVENEMIGDKYFDISIIGMDLPEAIDTGILQKINYAVAIQDVIDLTEDERRITKKFNVDTTHNTVKNIIQGNQNVNHWLVYFSFINELNENIPYFEKYFSKYKLFIIHTNVSNCENIIKQFEEYEGKAMLISVSMVLEGIHPKSVEGILLYRNVQSSNTLLQIIGRLGIINPNANPIIVDIYNSYSNFITSDIVKSMCDTDSEDCENHIESIRKYLYMSSNTYKFIELSSFIYKFRYNKYIYSYRGYEWRTINELAAKLGKCYKYVFTRICNGYTFEQIIDEFLDVPVVKSYRGYEWTTYTELSLKLGMHSDYVSNLVSQKGLTCEQIIDRVLNKPSVKSYRGYEWSTDYELSKKLGKYDNYVNKKLHDGMTHEQIIDGILDITIRSYRGYEWSNNTELSRQLGKSGPYVAYWLRKGKTHEEIIDDIIRCNSGENKQIYRDIEWRNMTDLATKLGVSYSFIFDRYTKYGKTYEQIIDEALDYVNNIKSCQSYKCYTWTSNIDLSRQLGKHDQYVSQYRHRGKTYQEIIDTVLSKNLNNHCYEPKSYRGYTWCDNTDLSRQLGKYIHYVKYHRQQGKTYKEIIDNVLDNSYDNVHRYRNYEWSSDADLSRQLGRHRNYVYKKRCIGMTPEQIIDHVLDSKN